MKDWNKRGLADLMRSFHDASQILEEKCKGDLSKADKSSPEFTNTLIAYADICCAISDLFNIDCKQVAFN